MSVVEPEASLADGCIPRAWLPLLFRLEWLHNIWPLPLCRMHSMRRLQPSLNSQGAISVMPLVRRWSNKVGANQQCNLICP